MMRNVSLVPIGISVRTLQGHTPRIRMAQILYLHIHYSPLYYHIIVKQIFTILLVIWFPFDLRTLQKSQINTP